MTARQDGDVIFGGGPPSGLNGHSALTNKLIIKKRLNTEGICLLKTNKKTWSPDKTATLFLVWDAPRDMHGPGGPRARADILNNKTDRARPATGRALNHRPVSESKKSQLQQKYQK